MRLITRLTSASLVALLFLLAGCPALLSDWTISDLRVGDASVDGGAAEGGGAESGASQDATSNDGPWGEGGQLADATAEAAPEAEAGPTCVTDLSGIGTGDFYVSFNLVTTAQTSMALVSQRSTCATSMEWDVFMSPSGGIET